MRPTRIALALALVFSLARVALADPPPAEFTVSFDGDAAIWNPFAGFEACETFTEQGISATLCLGLDDVFCDGSGKCTCFVTFTFEGDLDGLLTGDCTTKVSCKPPSDPTKPVCKAKLSFDAEGAVSGFGTFCDARLSNFAVNGPVDAAGLFRGSAHSQLCLDCTNGARDCGGVAGDFDYQVNPPTPWNLTVEVAPDPQNPNALLGDASDDLGFDYTAKGKYNAKTDQSTLTIKGVTRKADPASVSQGASVQLKELGCEAGQCTEGTATFKVQGNAVKDAPVGP